MSGIDDLLRWRKYIGEITNIHVSAFWGQLNALVPGAPLPVSIPSADEGGFQLAWDTVRYHLDVVISATGDLEWFFDDRQDPENWDEGEEITALSTHLLEMTRPTKK